MSVREKLIELVGQVQDCGCDVTDVVDMNYVENNVLVDHLIANGVTVKIKKEKPPTDLTNKCGSCVYASAENKECFANTPSYIRCTDPTKRWIREIAAYKTRTTRACKRYKPLPDLPKE